MSDVEVFELWVNILYEKIVIQTKNNFAKHPEKKELYLNRGDVDPHFRPQIYDCHLFDFVNIFDFIIIYDKNTFAQSVYFVFEQIMLRNGENFTLTKDYYLNGWGKSQSESLFDRGLQRRTKSNDQEMKLLKKFFNIDLIQKAIEIYQYDYQLLPLDPPLWISDMFDVKLQFAK